MGENIRKNWCKGFRRGPIELPHLLLFLHLANKFLLHTKFMPDMVLSNGNTRQGNIRPKRKKLLNTASILIQHVFIEHRCPYFREIGLVSPYCFIELLILTLFTCGLPVHWVLIQACSLACQELYAG